MNKHFSILTTLIAVLILCGSTMATHAEVVGYWSFDNSEHIGEDASPNHNHGELKGRDTAKRVRGKAGGGLQLDGGSWLEVPHNESLNLKDQLTLMCWVKFADLNDFASQGRSQGLIWKPTSDRRDLASYGLDVDRDQLELHLPLYSKNNFRLYVINPKCTGQFIAGIPDFPAACQRRFIYDRIGSKFGGLRFYASTQGRNRTVYAVHPTFFAKFFMLDEHKQDFFTQLSRVMIGTSDIYLPRIVRDFENLDEIWFHFAAVADGKRIRLYVNGKKKVSQRHGLSRQTGPFINSQESLRIGRGRSAQYLDGVIDEVMILDNALTENEIKKAMELGKAGISLDRFLFDAQGVSVVAPNSPPIYWTDKNTGKIQRTSPDGTHVEELVTGLIRPENIALDVVGGKMYWTDIGKTQRANLDGTHVEDLVVGRHLSDIALDVAGGKIYWANIGKIQRANLDGTHVEDLFTNARVLVGGHLFPPGSIESITLDVVGGKMYWAGSKIQRANLDGTHVEELIEGNLFVPKGITLDVVGGKMYWADIGRIQRANLDGTHVEELVDKWPSDIALDVVGGKMYWADKGKIQRANLDGTHVEDVVTGLSFPAGIALILSSAPSPGAPALIPEQTTLLPNYPNPFNPETWIPYQLAAPADVTLTIYAVDGTVVRTLAFGHQPTGIYQSRGRAAYWDGRNAVGERVASGLYYYTLSAGDFTATRKMLIIK